MQAALAIELVEDHPHHLLSLLVGVEGQPAAGFAYIADRRVVEQLAAAGLVQSPLVHPEAQEVELGLAHDTLQTQAALSQKSGSSSGVPGVTRPFQMRRLS